MLVMVALTYDAARQVEITEHIPAEQARGRELMAQGTMQALYVAQAQDRVWLVLRTASLGRPKCFQPEVAKYAQRRHPCIYRRINLEAFSAVARRAESRPYTPSRASS